LSTTRVKGKERKGRKKAHSWLKFIVQTEQHRHNDGEKDEGKRQSQIISIPKDTRALA
jgi:hypothetical protein